MSRDIWVGIVGDWNPQMPSHRATEVALGHAAAYLPIDVHCAWVPTLQVEGDGAENTLGQFAALWCAPGSPYRSMAGALQAIRYAREGNRPFLGT